MCRSRVTINNIIRSATDRLAVLSRESVARRASRVARRASMGGRDHFSMRGNGGVDGQKQATSSLRE